jgi:hypothetical protein
MEDENLDNKTEKELIAEFVKRFQTLEDESEIIKQGKKDLKEEFKEKIDLKTLDKVIRVLKIRVKVEHQDTFDSMMEQLESEYL